MAKQQELLVAELGAVDNTQAAFNSVQRNIKRTADQSKHLNGQLRIVRGGFGQLGHQVQDIAVQLQMGTNALIVFGQQGSQIASLMGPKGALVGALLAVGAALGMTFINKTKDATNELEALRSKILETIEATGNLSEDFQNFLSFARGKELEQQQKTFDKTIEQYESASARLTLYENRLAEVIQAEKDGDTATLRALKTKEEYNRLIADQKGEISRLRVELRFLKDDLDGVTEATRADAQRRIDANKRLFDSTHTELDLLVKAKEKKDKEAADEEKRQDLIMKARLAALNNLHSNNNYEMEALRRIDEKRQENADNEVERQNLSNEARLAAAKNLIDITNMELDEIVRAEEAKKRAREQTLQFTQNTLGSLASMMEEGSKEQKALLVAEQGMRVVSATMAAFDAANKAMAASGGNPVVGNLVLALGLANAAAIAGQAIASFEGGGMIPDGPRAGGVDGRGGRMAIVHPNEKITDMRRGGGDNKPVNISFNIQANDAQGFDELLVKRRALIVNMVNKAVNNSGRRSLT